jgi:hypothetical protein
VSEAAQDPRKPFLGIAADAGYFDEQAVEAAAAELTPYFRVSTSRLYQFSEAPPIAFVLEFVRDHVVDAVAAAALIEFIKRWFFRESRTTILTLKFRDRHRVVDCHFKTDDPVVAEQAIPHVFDLVHGTSDFYAYDNRSGRWVDHPLEEDDTT